MTTEEKAKAYDKALERAIKINSGEGVDASPEWTVCEVIFPELRNEDNIIKRQIINYFQCQSREEPCRKHIHDKWIDWLEKQKDTNVLIQEASEKAYTEGMRVERKHWLEKQGEQLIEPKWNHHKVDLSDCSEEYQKGYYDGWNNCNMQHSQCRSELDDVIKCLINGMKFYYEINEAATWGTDKWSMPIKHIIEVLERQDKQISISSSISTNKFSDDKYATITQKEFEPKNINEYTEAVIKQNPVESSRDYHSIDPNFGKPIDFKASNWYVSKVDRKIHDLTYNSTDKTEPTFKVGDWIVTDKNNITQIKAVNNGYYTIDNGMDFNMPYVNKYWRLWTIQDAKDGDVLVNGSNIFIFHFINGTRLMGYCHVNTDDGRFYDDIGKNEYFCLVDAVINPATKEQCNLLFQKMKETGYGWDANKKELKKINSYCQENCKGYQETGKCFADGGCDAKRKAEHKPAWSRDDEKMLHTIIADFKGFKHDNTSTLESHFNECIDWLKSLKDRVQPQLQLEWDEEDEKHSSYICAALDCYYRLRKDRNNTNGQENLDKARNWLYNKLKSFKPQNSITDEELARAKKDAYNDALDKIEYHSGEPTFDDGWSAAINYLRKKSFKPRKQQKPKHAWGKEDKDMLYKATAVVNRLCAEGKEYVWSVNTLKELFCWLKSLKTILEEN